MSKALINIREFNVETDFKSVEKLETNCAAVTSDNNVSMFCDIIGDPLCRIKAYSLHVMLVAEMPEHGELVGVVRACIKDIGFGIERTHLKMGLILGLRVCPRHRRKGIGFNLMKAIEGWLVSKGAEYVYLATEDNNVASRNLFTLKFNYKVLSQLQIYVLPIENHVNTLSCKLNIKKLHVNQAISFYNNQLKCKDLYPVDIETILRESPSLGTWVISYFNNEEDHDHKAETIMVTKKQGSWIVFGLWNNCEAYKVGTSCFGFVFMYGVFGEGKKLEELMEGAWNFAAKMAKDVEYKVVMTEVSNGDPLRKYVSIESSTLCINDVWYIKNMSEKCGGDGNDEEKIRGLYGDFGDVFVDPRDF